MPLHLSQLFQNSWDIGLRLESVRPACVDICWYFWISTMYIPAHTNTYLHIVTYLQIAKHTECHYVVGIYFRYLQIYYLLFDIPTHTY